MRHLFESKRVNKASDGFEREIAPGVRVRIRRLPASFALTGHSPLASIGEPLHDAWDVLWGKAHATSPDFQRRLHGQRRAA